MKKHFVAKQASIVLLCAVMASACSSQAATDTSEQTSAEATAQATTAVQTAAAAGASTQVIQKIEYAADDKYTDWSTSNATKIELNVNSFITESLDRFDEMMLSLAFDQPADAEHPKRTLMGHRLTRRKTG